MLRLYPPALSSLPLSYILSALPSTSCLSLSPSSSFPDASLAIPNPKNTRKTFVNNADAVVVDDALNLKPQSQRPDPNPIPIPILIPIPQSPFPSSFLLQQRLPVSRQRRKHKGRQLEMIHAPAELSSCLHPTPLHLLPSPPLLLGAEFIKLGVTFVVANLPGTLQPSAILSCMFATLSAASVAASLPQHPPLPLPVFVVTSSARRAPSTTPPPSAANTCESFRVFAHYFCYPSERFA